MACHLSLWRILIIHSGFLHLAAGLSVGLTGLAAGYAIGVVGDAGVRAYLQQSRVFVGMVLILIFAEVLGLYGYKTTPNEIARLTCSRLIVALILNTRANA